MASQWQRIAANVSNKSIEVTRAAFVKVGTRIIQDTPVDSGMLRNNWLSGIDRENTKENPANTLGGDALEMLRLKVDLLNINATLYFTNPMPYAERIEYYGHSQQAKNGMLVKNIIQWPKIVDETARQMK